VRKEQNADNYDKGDLLRFLSQSEKTFFYAESAEDIIRRERRGNYTQRAQRMLYAENAEDVICRERRGCYTQRSQRKLYAESAEDVISRERSVTC
jgi:hypothetical protein